MLYLYRICRFFNAVTTPLRAVLTGKGLSFFVVISTLSLLTLLYPSRDSLAQEQERQELRQTEEDKVEKRLRFNRYVEKLLVEKALKEQKKRKEEWSVSGTASVGYDNNVALDPRRDGDIFHEESFDGSLALPHSGIPDLLGPGDFGARITTDFRDYGDHDDFDYHTTRLKPFIKTTVFERLRLDVEYTLEYIRYIRNNQINYVGHRGKVKIMESLGDHLAHRFYFQYRIKDYIDRKAKSAVNTPLEAGRKDHNYEPGYELFFFPSTSTVAGATGAWVFNESNDLHRDFHDYQGYRLSSFLSQKFGDLFTWIIGGGYQYKTYESRTFTGSGSAERDHYFYVSSYVYVPINDHTQLVFKYLYGQNNSNSPIQEYSSSTSSLGINIRF